MFASHSYIHVYADLLGLRASEGPQATNLLIISYRPDTVVYNSETFSVALLELTCPLDSKHHIEAARSRKQNKTEYLQVLAEFDRLRIVSCYETVKISVLYSILSALFHPD